MRGHYYVIKAFIGGEGGEGGEWVLVEQGGCHWQYPTHEAAAADMDDERFDEYQLLMIDRIDVV